MGAIISCCCYCCDKTSNKYEENYQSTILNDTSSKAYDNKIHVSEIYGNSIFIKRNKKKKNILLNYISDNDVELAPSDNPTTSTYFQSILHPSKEFTQQPISLSSQLEVNSVNTLPESSYTREQNTTMSVNQRLCRTTLNSTLSLSPC
ncbi:unnamed protein product, partial [Rotaria sp. Silwood2]